MSEEEEKEAEEQRIVLNYKFCQHQKRVNFWVLIKFVIMFTMHGMNNMKCIYSTFCSLSVYPQHVTVLLSIKLIGSIEGKITL